MRKKRTVLAFAVAAASLVAGLAIPSRFDEANAAIGGVVWEDNFDRPAGEPVDASKWRFDIGGGGWGNNELQYYTNRRENASHDGQGNLVITARRENPDNLQCHYGRCEYTSARLLTAGKFTQKYGRFEARIKLPRGQGIWPAFWMLGDNFGNVGWPQSGEIDIMENVGKEPNTVYGTVHGPGYSGSGGITGRRDIGRPLADEFHRYAVEWEPNEIRWYLDGSEFHRVTVGSLGGRQWVFDHPFFMILNVAVGGHWPGNPDGSTQFPQSMVVDYVRVWGHDGGGGNNGGPTADGIRLRSEFSGRCIDIPNTNDGAKLQVWDCHDGPNQRWSLQADGTVRSMGKCMDPAWAGTANGTDIQVVSCNGHPAQRFTLNGAGDLVNLSANRCVDIRDWNNGNGARLQLWDCSGKSNQKWQRA